jgi:DNA-binding transcriptional LysR family regulator
MIELRQFRQFIAVAEALSFRRAAERLRMAQPPLTPAVKRIESELGGKLLDSSNRAVQLTEPGRAFLEEARRTIAQAERATEAARRAAEGLTGILRVTFVPTLAHDVLPRLLRAFRQDHPRVHLDLSEAPTGPQGVALRNDLADVGLLVPPVANSSGLIVEPVLHQELFAAIPTGHRLAARKAVRLADLRDEQWILSPPLQAPGFHSLIVTACGKAGFAPNVMQQAVQVDTILGLIAGGLGVCLVPGPLVYPRDGVVFRKLTGPFTPVRYQLAAAWRQDNANPALTAFLDTVRMIMSQRHPMRRACGPSRRPASVLRGN